VIPSWFAESKKPNSPSASATTSAMSPFEGKSGIRFRRLHFFQ
jgi:hypothetical protein